MTAKEAQHEMVQQNEREQKLEQTIELLLPPSSNGNNSPAAKYSQTLFAWLHFRPAA